MMRLFMMLSICVVYFFYDRILYSEDRGIETPFTRLEKCALKNELGLNSSWNELSIKKFITSKKHIVRRNTYVCLWEYAKSRSSMERKKAIDWLRERIPFRLH